MSHYCQVSHNCKLKTHFQLFPLLVFEVGEQIGTLWLKWAAGPDEKASKESGKFLGWPKPLDFQKIYSWEVEISSFSFQKSYMEMGESLSQECLIPIYIYLRFIHVYLWVLSNSQQGGEQI